MIVLNCRGSQLFKYNRVNEGVPVSSVTLCSLAELADRPGIERVEVIDHLLAQADGRPDRDREAERVEERQDPQQHLVGLQVDLLLDLMDVGEDVAVRRTTPLGSPVDPEVKITVAVASRLSSSEPGNERAQEPDRHQLGDGRGPELVGQPHLLAGCPRAGSAAPWA